MEKTLTESKKAKSAWLGTGISIAFIIGGYKIGLPLEYIQMGIGAIVGLFGTQILGQGVQDTFGKKAETNTNKS